MILTGRTRPILGSAISGDVGRSHVRPSILSYPRAALKEAQGDKKPTKERGDGAHVLACAIRPVAGFESGPAVHCQRMTRNTTNS